VAEKHNYKLITFAVSIIFSVSALASAVAADPLAGIIAPARDSNKPAVQQQPKPPAKKTGYSFLSPTAEEKQQQQVIQNTKQNNQKKPEEKKPNNAQFYKSYDSYNSYYKEQAAKKLQRRSKLFDDQEVKSEYDPLFAGVGAGVLQFSGIELKPVTPQGFQMLSMVQLESAEGLPVTASIKRRVVSLIDKVKDKTIPEKEKRKMFDEEITSLDNMAKALRFQQPYLEDAQKQKGLPEAYTSQVNRDNKEAAALIDEALETLSKY